MNKILTSILLLLTLIACEQSDVQPNVNEEVERMPIGLSITIDEGESTRAEAELIHDASDVGSIGLYIYVERPNGEVEVLGENLKLNYVDGEVLWEWDDDSSAPTWDYTDGSDRYTFYGYAPYRADGRGVNFNAENDEFSVKYSMDDNQDLMVAQTRSIVCPIGGVVTLDLRHTLSAMSLNTTYTSVITNVELVVSDNYYAAMPIDGEVRLGENDVVEWSGLEYATSAERYKMSNEARSYILLLPQTTTDKGDLFFSITSVNNGKTVIDENAKIPQMTLISHGIYKFNYKEPYFDIDDDDLVIHVADIMLDKNSWNDYSAIDEAIQNIKDKGHSKVIIVGEPANETDAYHVISHILKNSGLENYDLSGYIIPDNKNENIPNLPYNLFHKNTSIKNVVMPIIKDGDMSVRCFLGCSALESVVFPEGQKLTILPEDTFENCTALTSVKFDMTSDTLKEIGQEAFHGCIGLEDIEMPSSVETIGYGAFQDCKALSKINIPAAVTNISGNAFMNCTSLYSYTENRGIIFDERSAQDEAIIVGWHGFLNTHVRYSDIPYGYVNSGTSNEGYFAEP